MSNDTTQTQSSPFSLSGKTIVLTGATGVLGDAFVKAVAAAGANTIILGRNKEVAASRSEALRKEGHQSDYFICDVLDEKSLEEVAEKLMGKYGAIHGLVNAAGGNKPGAVVMPDQDIFDLNPSALQDVFNLNLLGTVLPTMIFGKRMAAGDGGSIVNISSVAAGNALTRVLGYSMAKAAVDNFTKWMGVELALRQYRNMRVNAIAPGFFLAEQNRSLLMNPDGSLTPRGQAVISNTPFGRFGEPAELGGTLVWLLSEASRFVSGEIVHVDGAFCAWSGV